MSKVDMSVFEDVLEFYDGGISDMLFNMCEGDFRVTLNSFKEYPAYPRYSLKESDPELYNKQYSAYQEVRDYNNKLEEDYMESIGYKHLDQNGGGEGGQEACTGIFSFKGKIYCCEYAYYSFNGHEYDYIEDTIHEVKPVEKVITVYEKI
tara:strand:+ start:87380 stop:87829 length:450 start_codon:yes stop_codon:yes gene_type:complete